MDSSNLDIGTVLRDPDFQGLSTIEKRKFLLDADPDFRNLPVGEQSKFIISLTPSSGQIPPENPSAFDYKGIGGPVTGIALKAVPQLYQDIKEQVTPTPESLAGPVGTPLRAVVDTTQFVRRALTEPAGQAAEEFAGSAVPFPAAKFGQELGQKKYVEAATTAALSVAELAGLGKLGKVNEAQGIRPKIEPVVANESLGQALQSYLERFKTNIGTEIGKHVDNMIAAVDDPVRNPGGAIDATSKIQALQKGFQEYSHTVTDMNLKPSPVIAKVVEEAIQRPRWTMAEAKDVRTAVLDMQRQAPSRMKGALGDFVGELTTDMRKAADRAGVASDFDFYNKLTKQKAYVQDQFLDSVLNANSGTDAMGLLTSSKEGPIKINYDALRAYGVDPKVVTGAINLSKGLTGKANFLSRWVMRSTGGHAAIALGLPYAAGWFGVEMAQALRGKAGVPVENPTVLEGQKIAQSRIPSAPTPVSTPSEVPVEPFTPSALPGAKRQPMLPAIPTAEAVPEAAPEPVKPPPPPSRLVQEASRRLALNKLKNALNKNEPLSPDQTEFLKSKGVDPEKAGALGAAHRVIQGELAKLTGKEAKATPKQGSPIPPVPKAKPPEGGEPPAGAASPSTPPITPPATPPPAASALETPKAEPESRLKTQPAAPQKAWGMSREDFSAKPPKGFVFDQNLPHEADVHSNAGKITVGPKFFDLPPEARKAAVMHEIGHELSDLMLADGSAFELADRGAFGPKRPDGSIEGINGARTPGENVAEAYSLIQTEPEWLKKNYPDAYRTISARIGKGAKPKASTPSAITQAAGEVPRMAAPATVEQVSSRIQAEKPWESHPAEEGIARKAVGRGNDLTFRVVRNPEEANAILDSLKAGNPAAGFRAASVVDGHALSAKAPKIASAIKKGAVPFFTSPYPSASSFYRGGADLFLAIEHDPKGLIYKSSRAGSTQGASYSATFPDAEHVIDARSVKSVSVLSPEQVQRIAEHEKAFEAGTRKGYFKGSYKDVDPELAKANVEASRNLEARRASLGRPFIEEPITLDNGLSVKKGDRVRFKGGATGTLSSTREFTPEQQAAYHGGERRAFEVTKATGTLPENFEGQGQSSARLNQYAGNIEAVWDKTTKRWITPRPD